MNTNTKTIFFVMGVSGSGKSTIGELLAKELNVTFFDADDYHPETNVAKMAAGKPLNDEDRRGWLQTLNALAKKHTKKGAVIACSSLKEAYRDLLKQEIAEKTEFIYLSGTYEEIMNRLQKRHAHFMPPALLQSQFDTLEEPSEAITVSITHQPEEIISKIINQI